MTSTGATFTELARRSKAYAEAPRFWLWATGALALAHAILILTSPTPP